LSGIGQVYVTMLTKSSAGYQIITLIEPLMTTWSIFYNPWWDPIVIIDLLLLYCQSLMIIMVIIFWTWLTHQLLSGIGQVYVTMLTKSSIWKKCKYLLFRNKINEKNNCFINFVRWFKPRVLTWCNIYTIYIVGKYKTYLYLYCISVYITDDAIEND
jgi:hypothetical protein